jgi:hypothetical protein
LIELLFYDAHEEAAVIEIEAILKDKKIMQAFHANALNFDFINNLMGPTFPTQVHNNTGVLKYKGIHFIFRLEDYDPDSENKFENSTLLKLCVFKTAENSKGEYELLEGLQSQTYPQLPRSSIHLGKGITINTGSSEISINFGDHVQKVLSSLKNPNQIFKKEDGSGYFLNYFNYGLDVFVREETNEVGKIILHGNYPIDPNFSMYERSLYDLQVGDVSIYPGSDWAEIKEDVSKELIG